MSHHTQEEQEEFLEKIDNVQKQIQDIMDGKIDVEALDKADAE
jgi:hypothetical protein